MTLDQFDALADLMRLRNGPAKGVARMVLVEGAAIADAARVQQLSYQAAHQAVKRAQRGIDLAKRIAG